MALDDFYASAAVPKVYRPKKPKTDGPTAKARAKKFRHTVRISSARKREVRALDGERCRWPECDSPRDSFWGSLEVAHVTAAGMGGDPQLRRTTKENLWTTCRWHHQGPTSLHSGDLKVRLLTSHGTRGPVECLRREPGESGKWYVVGVSSPPKIGMRHAE